MEELDALEKRVLESLRNAPTGRLRSEMAKGKYPQYYVIIEEERQKYPKGRYLRKSEIGIARAYAQKEYDELILTEIRKRKRQLSGMMAFEECSKVRDVYGKMSTAKQYLVTPYFLPDSDYVEKWIHSRIKMENSFPILNAFITEKGEKVRSKSEKIIADRFYLREIPYKYEAGLVIGQRSVVYPDFTLLNRRTREEFYLEHFGMMDNQEYCKNALEKIDKYQQNGIYVGEKLLLSFESGLKNLNLQQIDLFIEKYLL